MSPLTAHALPLISLAGLRSADLAERARVARELRAACVDTGFFYVTDHGVPDAVLDAMIAEARRFFALPLERKMAVVSSPAAHYRGYEPLRLQTLEPGTPPDLKEGFSIDGVGGPNQWPDGLPGFRETLEAYQRAMYALAAQVLRGLALSLDLPEDALDGFNDGASGIVRLVHYPPQPADAAPDEKGCGAHTDWGAFTFLLQDDAGGLQVWSRETDGWVDATPIRGTFVVNIGDMMARWTNDRYRSTRHRVVNRSGRERTSIPFFFMGPPQYDVTCIPTCLEPGAAPRYAPTTPARHLAEMIRLTFPG
jgi:isopenicillin N synthase-like dioxygenase